MPSYLYKINKNTYFKIDEISLAGWRIIYNIFKRKNLYSELKEDRNGIGWEISKSELKEQLLLDGYEEDHYEIVYDVEPTKIRTNLKQLEKLYLYTHNYHENKAHWTVIMLILKDILFEDSRILNKEKFDPNPNGKEIVEFLYLQGDDGSWSYGKVGQMNAAMIEPDARDYFRKYF